MQPSTCTMFVNAKYVLIPLLQWRKYEGEREFRGIAPPLKQNKQ